MGIQVNITSSAFVFLTCFLALPESLKVFTFMMVVGIISLGLVDEQRHSSTTEGLASELLKRVMCCIIEGIKGGWYQARNEHTENRIRNTDTENRIRNTDREHRNQARNTEHTNRNGHSKQHAQQQWNRNRNRNRKTNRSIANLIRKALRRNNRSGLQPSWRSTLPTNSNKIYEKNKKMSDNEDSGRGGGSSSGRQRTKDTGKETAQTTTKESYPEQQLMSALTLFPLPHQMGAPYFDGTDVTDFVIQWEDLTMDWKDGLRIKKVPLYCEKMVGRYVKTLESYIKGDNWERFVKELKEKYKEDDTEQKRNTEAYLQAMVQKMVTEKEPTISAYRSFIFEYCERSSLLVGSQVMNPHTRVLMFLQAFSDRVGDKICKRCGIDIEDAKTTAKVWDDVKNEALKICNKDDSQMGKLRKSKMPGESEPTKTVSKERKQKLEPTKNVANKTPEVLDEVTKMMKDLRLSQLEAQRKLEEELVFLREAFNKSPRQHISNGIRGCYWDGENHRKEDCQDLKRAIERGDVYQRDRLTFLGPQGVGNDGVLVPVPHEVNGKMKWQKEWVREQQSQMPRALCITVENNRDKPMRQSPKRVERHDEKTVEKLEKRHQHEKMWNTLRESTDIGEISKRTLDTRVPGVTVRELLSISPDMSQQWFGVNESR